MAMSAYDLDTERHEARLADLHAYGLHDGDPHEDCPTCAEVAEDA